MTIYKDEDYSGLSTQDYILKEPEIKKMVFTETAAIQLDRGKIVSIWVPKEEFLEKYKLV